MIPVGPNIHQRSGQKPTKNIFAIPSRLTATIFLPIAHAPPLALRHKKDAETMMMHAVTRKEPESVAATGTEVAAATVAANTTWTEPATRAQIAAGIVAGIVIVLCAEIAAATGAGKTAVTVAKTIAETITTRHLGIEAKAGNVTKSDPGIKSMTPLHPHANNVTLLLKLETKTHITQALRTNLDLRSLP